MGRWLAMIRTHPPPGYHNRRGIRIFQADPPANRVKTARQSLGSYRRGMPSASRLLTVRAAGQGPAAGSHPSCCHARPDCARPAGMALILRDEHNIAYDAAQVRAVFWGQTWRPLRLRDAEQKTARTRRSPRFFFLAVFASWRFRFPACPG